MRSSSFYVQPVQKEHVSSINEELELNVKAKLYCGMLETCCSQTKHLYDHDCA